MELVVLAASSAGVTITVAVSMFIMGRRAANAEERAGEEAVNSATIAGKLVAATLAADQWKARANQEAERADALATLLDEAAGQLDPAGARERMLAKWTRLHVPTGNPASDKPVPVPGEPDAARPSDLDLLKPGE